MNNQSTKDKDARSSNAMAATSHPLATEEALKILKIGGNAVDASIAASIVLSVVEPNATSIGGDCFAIVKMDNKDAVSFNGSGLAPEKLNYNFFKDRNIDKIGLTSPHSVTIPGALNAWEKIHKEFGKLDFEQLFLGAIDIAKNGHRVTKVVSNAWKNSLNKINGTMNNQSTKDKDARSSNAMAATSHPLATEEALKILKIGGNAVDASIAASIVLSVVEPNATSIGGDCFAIVKMDNKDAVSFNGSGLAPEKLNYNFFKDRNIDKIGLTSPHSVTIPGALNAWEKIHKEFGKLDFEQLFLGAIDIAKNGHRVTKVVSNAWKNSLNKINGNENSKKIFLKDGRTYQENELMKNIALGETLEAISKKGSKEFYEGEIAKDIIETLNELGGVHTFEDFSKQSTIRSDTIKSNYKGDFIHQCPPNGPGVTVLIMMKLLEKLNIQNYKFNSTERFHLEAEVTKQAYKVKETILGLSLIHI